MVVQLLRNSYGFCTKRNPKRPFYSSCLPMPSGVFDNGFDHAEPSTGSGYHDDPHPISRIRDVLDTVEADSNTLRRSSLSASSAGDPQSSSKYRMASECMNMSLVERTLSRLMESVHSINSKELADSVSWINRTFDTLTFHECALALRYAAYVSYGKETNSEMKMLVSNVCDRAEYLISQPVENRQTSDLRMLCSLMDLSKGFPHTLTLMTRLIQDVDIGDLFRDPTLLLMLKGSMQLRDVIIPRISHVNVSALKLLSSCRLLDLAVSVDNADNDLVSEILKQLPELMVADQNRGPLYATLAGLAAEYPASCVWESEPMRDLISFIVKNRLFPARPSRANIALADAMCRTGGISVFSSPAAYDVIRLAFATPVVDQEQTAALLRVCSEYQLPSTLLQIPSARMRAGHQARMFIKEVKQNIGSQSAPVIAEYAMIAARHTSGIPILVTAWTATFNRITALADARLAGPDDLIKFVNAVKTSRCPDTVKVMIHRSLTPLILMALRNQDSIDMRLVQCVDSGPSELDTKIRTELVQKQAGMIRIAERTVPVQAAIRAAQWISAKRVTQVSSETVEVIRSFITKSLDRHISAADRIRLLTTIESGDLRWLPLVQFALDDLRVSSLTVQEYVVLGDVITRGFACAEMRVQWREQARFKVLPEDREKLQGDFSDAELLGALRRKLDRITLWRLFPDRTGDNPLAAVKAFCGFFLTLTVTASLVTADNVAL